MRRIVPLGRPQFVTISSEFQRNKAIRFIFFFLIKKIYIFFVFYFENLELTFKLIMRNKLSTNDTKNKVKTKTKRNRKSKRKEWQFAEDCYTKATRKENSRVNAEPKDSDGLWFIKESFLKQLCRSCGSRSRSRSRSERSVPKDLFSSCFSATS